MSTTRNEYDKGDLVRVSGAFTDTDGDAMDPAAVLFKVKDPEGTVTTYTYGSDVALVKASVGNYYVDVNANQAGTWHYRFHSTGNGQAADEGTFTVVASQF